MIPGSKAPSGINRAQYVCLQAGLWEGGERMYLNETKVYRECIENAFLSYDTRKIYDKNANEPTTE